MDISTGNMIAFFSALVALGSAAISVRNLRREQINQELAKARWKRDYFADLLKWSDEAMLQLSEALHLCDFTVEHIEEKAFFDMKHALKVKLSAQIDRGRWFFPNLHTDMHGHENHEAFRGFRHPALDGLVVAYRSLDKIDHSQPMSSMDQRKVINGSKRLFTTEIQKKLDPGSRDKEYKKLIESADAE